MSREAVNEIIAKARTDRAFEQQLLDDPAAALDPYAERLTAQEKEQLSSIRADPFTLAALIDERPEPWWRSFTPGSFKEVGGSVLSLVLVLAFMTLLIVALVRIGSDPRAVDVGGSSQTVDEYSRAKDLLLVIVPLFGAVVTFWLGVAVEGRRADEHKQNAAQAGKERDEAKESERKKTTTAATVIAEIKQAIKHLRAGSSEPGTRAAPGEPPPLTRELDELDVMLDQARQRIES
jgi:hypothetical protein